MSSDDDIEDIIYSQQQIDKVTNTTTKQKIDEMASAGLTTIDDDYQAYLELANSPLKPFGDDILSYDEFVAINYVQHLQRLGFLPQMGTVSNGIQAYTTVRQFLTAAQSMKADTAETIRQFKDIASEARNLGTPFMKVGNVGDDGNRGGGSGNGGNREYNFGSSAHFDASVLSKNTRPIEVRLNTGIDANCYGPYYNNAVAENAPLHISQVKVSLNGIANGSNLDNYYRLMIVNSFQNLAQRAVSYNVNASTNFSYTNLTAYFNSVVNGLSIYYFYANIIVFVDNNNNKNEGMSTLRNMMSAQDLNDLHLLKDTLEQCPIPPNLNHFIFYISQVFRESALPGSALLKIMPFGFTTTTDVNNKFTSLPVGTVTNANILLATGSIRETISQMAKVCPGWTSERLLAPSDLPLHDPGYTTLWTNLYTWSSSAGGSTYRTPTVTSDDTSIVYQSHTNDLDGALYGMQAIYNSTYSTWLPSLFDVNCISSYATTRYTNRISFAIAGDGTPAFIPIIGSASIVTARAETYRNIGSTILNFQTFGSQRTLNVNVASIQDTTEELLKWLWSLDTVGSGVKALKMESISKVHHVNEGGNGRSKAKPKRKWNKKKEISSEL